MVRSALAPIALFVYKRPWHTQRVLDGLLTNLEVADSDLYIFSDGAKDSAAEQAVVSVRTLARSVEGFRSVTLIEQPTNLGLAQSIISGVNRLTQQYGRVVVLEDDVVPSPHFLEFMNAALDRYQDVPEVVSVHGYSYPTRRPLPETFFLRGADCWGWATWARGWKIFEPNGAELLARLKALGQERQFDMDGSYPYTAMLKDQVAGRNDSWAIRWHASAFLADCLTLYPGASQVQNIGTDGSGTHGGATGVFAHASWGRRVHLGNIPLAESHEALEAFGDFLRRLQPSFSERVTNRIRKLLGGGM